MTIGERIGMTLLMLFVGMLVVFAFLTGIAACISVWRLIEVMV